MTSPIRVRGLRKSYDSREAVAGIDLEVHRGEVFALLGPNGAGKTTTVEILEGLRRRDAGVVEVLGLDPQGAGRAWRDRIGIVLQSSGGLDLLTVREIVASTARSYSRPRPVEEAIEAVGLGASAATRLGRLSGGQRRRLDVALGILGSPEMLFLDEPTTGFDPQARRDFWELVRSLAAGGTTILLTTHYLDEAEQLADRLGVIAGGRMLAVDTPSAIRQGATATAVVSWDEAGTRHTVTTTNPTAQVIMLAQRFDGEVRGLTIARPSLEDVYLQLISPHMAEPPADPARALEGASR